MPISPPVTLAKMTMAVEQQQHGDEGDQSEIRAAQAQGGQGEQDAAHHGGGGATNQTERDGDTGVVHQPGAIGAKANQECRAKIHFAGEAEQQVPRHGEDAEVDRRW